MRLNKDLSKEQLILNNTMYKNDFTHALSDTKSRYVVSIKNLYKGSNPSLDFELLNKITKIVDSEQFDSIGGWNGPDGTYYLDANLHLNKLEYAIGAAKNCNQISVWDMEAEEVIYI